MKSSISWLAIAPLVFATPAFCMPAATELTYSFPGARTIEREPVPFVQLGFGGAVDMVTVEIANPDDTQTELYNAATDLVPMKKNAMFGIALPTSLESPGDYRISYTIAVPGKDTTAETISGSFSFTIDLPVQPAADAPQHGATEKAD